MNRFEFGNTTEFLTEEGRQAVEVTMWGPDRDDRKDDACVVIDTQTGIAYTGDWGTCTPVTVDDVVSDDEDDDDVWPNCTECDFDNF